MNLQVYQIIHLVAVMALFAGTGAALGGTDNIRLRKFGAMLRGIALLLIPVAGFGMLAKMGIMKSIPIWAWCKVGIWVIAAALPIFVKRKMLSGTGAVFVALLLGGLAAWLGIMKPF